MTNLFDADDLGAIQEIEAAGGGSASPMTERLASLIPYGRRNAI